MIKTVLAVDDSSTVREVLRTTLENEGYQFVLAADGQEAISKLTSIKADMVVTDLNMPKMNGIALIRAIRSQPDCRFLPILMLTSENQMKLREEGKVAGASCWLNKPFKPENLLSVIQMILPV